MSIELILLISQAIDKMGIRKELANINITTDNEEKDIKQASENKKRDIERVSAEVFSLIIANMYKAKNEIYEFIVEYKNIVPEGINEDDKNYKKEQLKLAKKINILELFKEIKNIDGIADFFPLK